MTIDVKELRMRAHDHRWLPDQQRWTCEDDITALCDALESSQLECDGLREIAKALKERLDLDEHERMKVGNYAAGYRAGMLRAAEICGEYFDERSSDAINEDAEPIDALAAHEDAAVALKLSEAIRAEAEKGKSE